MPLMSIFGGALNVNITGGEFTEIQGNFNFVDQSLHHSNINSFNTTNRTILKSEIKNSSADQGVAQDARHPNQAPSRSQEGQASFPNGHPAFPPPSIHPTIPQPQYLPPGSRTVTVDSFNTRNEHIINVINDNSTEHATHGEEDDDKGDDKGGEADRPQHSGAALNSHRSFSQHPTYVPDAFPTTSGAQVAPGHTLGMTPNVQKTCEMLMQQVQGKTVPGPAHEEDSEGDSSKEEEQGPKMTDPASLNTRISNMSLDENFPTYSRVKSDPQNPSPASALTASPDPARQESTPCLPEHMQQPFVMPPSPGPTTPTSGPYATYAPESIPSWNGQHPSAESQTPHTGTPHAVPHTQGGLNSAYRGIPMAPPPPPPSGAVFTTIHGDYSKVDKSVHLVNIGSGNTHNTLIQEI